MAASYYVGSSPTIEVTCKDKIDGTVIDLTNYDVEIAYSIDGGTVTNVDMTPEGSASGGKEKYTFLIAKLDAEGDLEIQIILKHSNGTTVLKRDFIRRRVIKALA